MIEGELDIVELPLAVLEWIIDCCGMDIFEGGSGEYITLLFPPPDDEMFLLAPEFMTATLVTMVSLERDTLTLLDFVTEFVE